MSFRAVDDWGPISDQVCWSLFAFTLVVVILRIGCRITIRNGQYAIGLDDYVTIFCTIVLFVTCILMSIGTRNGLGRRMATLEPEMVPEALRWNIIISGVLVWAFSLPKFAIVAILKRILNYGTKTSLLFWSLAITSQASILAISVWWWVQCTPVEYGWDKTIEGGSCASLDILVNMGYFISAYTAFLDLFFALYPIPFVMRLNMTLRKRIAVSISLGLSSLAFIVSVYKLAIFGQAFRELEDDPTYPAPYLNMLGVAEGCILIICASLPTLG
ncbi:hypothetical protein B0I35DRAFT_465349, partial [Stachybotrys elegans]